MIGYTQRFAHLAKKPDLNVGDIVIFGDTIGRMGSTGQSTANHLHTDCVRGSCTGAFNLKEIGIGEKYTPAPKQCLLFIDKDLFGTEILVTTNYACPEYYWKRGKVHYGYDVVPENRHKTSANHNIMWNRSCHGRVIDVGYDDAYGYYISIYFET